MPMRPDLVHDVSINVRKYVCVCIYIYIYIYINIHTHLYQLMQSVTYTKIISDVFVTHA